MISEHDAYRSLLHALERASGNEPSEFWLACKALIRPFLAVDDEGGIALDHVGLIDNALDGVLDAHSADERLTWIEDATTDAWEALSVTGGLTEAEEMEDLVHGDAALRAMGFVPQDDLEFPEPR